MTFVASPKTIAVGVFAGLASAALVLSPVGGTLLAVPLTMVVELPLIIAALGWGTSAAIIATLAGTGALAAISLPLAAYFVLFVAPAAVIGSHLIGLARHVPPSPDDVGLKTPMEWYPFGRVMLYVALIVVASTVVISTLDGFDPSALTAADIRALASNYAVAMAEFDQSATPDQLTDLMLPAITTTIHILPFAFTATWTLIVTFNLGLGTWITTKSGNLARPGEDFAGIEVPGLVTPILGLAFLASLIGGTTGAIALSLAGAMSALLLASGLAVVHSVSRSFWFRLPLLLLVYVFLGLFALPLVMLGIAEPFARIRRRVAMRRAAGPPRP